MIVGGKLTERKEFTMKKAIALFVALSLLLTAAAAGAETKITVSGTGEVRVSADTAVISLGVSARNRDVLKAQQQVNENIASIRSALISEGVKEEDINTDFINIYPLYDYSGDHEQLTAYDASSTLAIKTTDMDRVGNLIDVSFAAGANTLNGISFSASDTAEAEAASLKKAVEAAREKAETLAEASGMKITGTDEISEGGVYSYSNSVGNVYSRGFDTAEEAGKDAGTVVQAAKLIVSATVSITFEAE